MNDKPNGKPFHGGRRRDGRMRAAGSGLTVTPAERILLKAIRDARFRLLRSGNQFDSNVADELKRAAEEWTELTGLPFPDDRTLDKEEV